MHALTEHNDSGDEKNLPICKACVNVGTQLVWSRGNKINKLQKKNAKWNHEETKRSNVSCKRRWCFMYSSKDNMVSQTKKSYIRDLKSSAVSCVPIIEVFYNIDNIWGCPM